MKERQMKRRNPYTHPTTMQDTYVVNIAIDSPERVRAWYARARKRIYKKEWATKEKEFEGCY